jgi:hypothetical protein
MKKRLAPVLFRVPIQLVQPVGLGDVVKKATNALGIKPCSGCARRAEALNRAVTFAERKRVR